jgi:hypothetical protein
MKSFAELSLNIDLLDHVNKLQIPVLVDKEFQMSFDVCFLGRAVRNLQSVYQLADIGLTDETDTVELEGILGVDVVQCLTTFELVSCMMGTAFRFGSKIIPWGNVEHFLSKKDVPKLYRALNSCDSVNRACVNFVLDPQQCHPDPLNSILQDSSVEGHLEKIFSLESIGICEDNYAASDMEKVNNFAKTIEFNLGKYYVALPWNEKISKVDSGFRVARAVLDRVVSKLGAQGQLGAYSDVFKQQLENGILEEVPLENFDCSDKIFIPHRAVIKSSPTCTTKVRPVLNCSLRVNGCPSINDAAFSGIDLMGDLFSLLISLRHDKFLLMSDVKQAFLQIKLSLESDKNKFCILWLKKDKLVVYRYTSIVFGFVASPFILNYVIKHHVSQMPDDLCSYFLLNNMYVDNLFITGDSPSSLLELYRN